MADSTETIGLNRLDESVSPFGSSHSSHVVIVWGGKDRCKCGGGGCRSCRSSNGKQHTIIRCCISSNSSNSISSSYSDSGSCMIRMMRPLVLSLILAMIVVLILVSVHNLESFDEEDDSESELVELLDRNNSSYLVVDGAKNNDKTQQWYDRFVRSMSGFFSYDEAGEELNKRNHNHNDHENYGILSVTPSGDYVKFQRVEHGCMNYRAPITSQLWPSSSTVTKPTTNARISNSSSSSNSGNESKHNSNSNSNNNNNNSTQDSERESIDKIQPYSESSQLITSDDNSSEFNGAITIDKIKGIDLPSRRMNKESPSKKQQQQQTTSSDHRSSCSAKCHNNKYDRLIAQKISLNDISRPIVKLDGRFDNPFPTWWHPSSVDLFKFIVFETDESNVPKKKQELDEQLPLLRPDFSIKDPKNHDFRVTWIGHSTLLIQVNGLNVLTDPIFSARASPTQYFGPKRIREPACEIKSLPPINIVLISHNHYDHLDANSVKEINDRFGNECRWIVPLGLGEFLQSMSVENYVELDWWQKDCFHVVSDSQSEIVRRTSPPSSLSATNNGNGAKRPINNAELDIYLTPSQHWSRRGVNDVNKSLWGSFTIVSRNGSTFFFAGDTGYCSAFKEIGKIFGPFTGAAIPIGAYKPRWFLKPSHVDPSEALQIHKDLKCMKSIAIHHSTFILANENYKEPAKRLAEHMENGTTNEPFISLKHGETAEFGKSY